MKKKEYDINDAVAVVGENLSSTTKLLISEEDVRIILDIFYDYKIEHNFIIEDEEYPKYLFYKDILEPLTLDAKSVCPWVCNQAAKKGYYYSEVSINEVYEAEIIYLESIGLAEEVDLNKFVKLKKIARSKKNRNN